DSVAGGVVCALRRVIYSRPVCSVCTCPPVARPPPFKAFRLLHRWEKKCGEVFFVSCKVRKFNKVKSS
uniref:Uncharacterized protein n=1 Tax=Anopheles minimus TaxID=112268 RepID=A0A182WQA6_9DIPT